MQSLEVSAFAFPVADGVADELKCGNAAEIRNGKDGIAYSLQPGVLAFLWKHVHLQETLIRVFLDFDQIRDLNRGPDLGKVCSLSCGEGLGFRHLLNSS